MRDLRVLVGCEMSGRVRDEFAQRGWEAWSADLLPSESPPYLAVCRDDPMLPPCSSVTDSSATAYGNHYVGDVRDLFSWEHPVNHERMHPGKPVREQLPLWDLFIGFPPCTDLALSGARWWPDKRADGRQDSAADFFMEMWHAPSPLVAVENPVGDMSRRFRPPDQVVQPWFFGDPYSKNTCLWLRGLNPLKADKPVEPIGRITTGGGSWRTDKAAERSAMNAYEDSEGRKNRAKVRSRTMPGFARAMASQWAKFAEDFYASKEGW